MIDFAIDVHGLEKSFGARHVVKDLSLQVAKGLVCGFLGGNGSGKTTTMRLLCGLLTPDAGEGRCLGYDILKEADSIRLRTGYMTQKFGLYGDLSVAENLDFVARLFELPNRAARIADVTREAGLTERADQLAATLSGGWKQRLALAACILHKPELLLLDEPTAGVDAEARRDFWDMIQALAGRGMTVLVSTHYMDEAERCARIVYLAEGRIMAEGTADEIVTQARLIAFQTQGDGLDQIAQFLRSRPGVSSATIFGRSLRVTGQDFATLRGSLDEAERQFNCRFEPIAPGLEDAFVHMLKVGRAAGP